jgi:hypothetical protein
MMIVQKGIDERGIGHSSEESDEKVVWETSGEHLGDHKNAGSERRLEHDGHA